MGIIGVVAALTLPNLNSSTGDREKVAKVKKIYQNLNDANGRAVAVYGPLKEWDNYSTCKNNVDEFQGCYLVLLSDFLKISKKKCEDTIILADGSEISISGYSENCTGTGGYNNSLSDICSDELAIDIDGSDKGKNEGGQDIFRFEISDSNGIVPHYCSVSNCMRYKDEYCTFWVIDYGNMDYLKTDIDGKCKNSSIVLDGVNNTTCK